MAGEVIRMMDGRDSGLSPGPAARPLQPRLLILTSPNGGSGQRVPPDRQGYPAGPADAQCAVRRRRVSGVDVLVADALVRYVPTRLALGLSGQEIADSPVL